MNWTGYIARRMLSSLGVLAGVVLLTYGLSRLADTDPVYAYLAMRNDGDLASGTDSDRAYRAAAKSLGLQRAAFFFSLSAKHKPDTLHLILPLQRRRQADAMLNEGYAWPQISAFQQSVWETNRSASAAELARQAVQVAQLEPSSLYAIPKARTTYSPWIPRLQWHGLDNGFVHFAGSLMKGQLGFSSQTGERVGSMLARAIRVTAPLAGLALLLSLLLTIWIGVWLARHDVAWARQLLYVVVSAPGFWLATVFVTQLSGRGKPFPGPGWRDATQSLGSWLSHASLPVLIFAIPAAAYLALVLDEALRRSDRLPIRDVARIHGLSERRVWWQDMLPLGIVPSLSTTLGLLIPSFLGGSVVIEYVFNIPGLGRLVFESILSRDWPVVLGVVVLSSMVTIVGYVFTDLVNALIDPRYRKIVVHAQ